MKVELFLDDIDRDVFTTVGTLNGTWKHIYKDLDAHLVHSPSISDPVAGDPLLSRIDEHFIWLSEIFLRKEEFGGLLYDVTRNKVFRLDTAAFKALAILKVGKETSFTNARFRHEEIVDLFDQLQAEGLVRSEGCAR